VVGHCVVFIVTGLGSRVWGSVFRIQGYTYIYVSFYI
jgi:hypothetical protein